MKVIWDLSNTAPPTAKLSETDFNTALKYIAIEQGGTPVDDTTPLDQLDVPLPNLKIGRRGGKWKGKGKGKGKEKEEEEGESSGWDESAPFNPRHPALSGAWFVKAKKYGKSRKRFFVLEPEHATLRYYAKFEKGKPSGPKGFIELTRDSEIKVAELTSLIVHTKTREWKLTAEQADVVLDWKAGVQMVVDGLREVGDDASNREDDGFKPSRKSGLFGRLFQTKKQAHLAFDFEKKLNEFQQQQQAVRDEKGQNEAEEEEEEKAPPLVPCRIKDFEVDQAKLTRLATLGHGNFGEVYKCLLDGKTLPVAAKVVRIDETKVKAEDREAHLRDETANLGREAVVMMGLGSNHPHVVSLVGIITCTGDLTVILTLEANGDLKQFLETNLNAGTPVLLEEKRRWAHEIANGMKHVSGLHVVHRDVAARNIMVSESRICKIADFGLARAMKKKEELETDGEKEEADYERYYRSEAAAVLVRWTAPEGLLTCRFSVASDVWSYAIVIVEIWQNGSKLYPQLSNAGLMRQLRDDPNFVHPKPGDDCSEELYSLLKECWRRDPKQRPSFPQILKRLEKMDGGIKRAFADQDNLPTDAPAITIVEATNDVGGAAKPRAAVQPLKKEEKADKLTALVAASVESTVPDAGD